MGENIFDTLAHCALYHSTPPSPFFFILSVLVANRKPSGSFSGIVPPSGSGEWLTIIQLLE